MLKAIRQAVKLELQLIANSNCLMFCPMSGQHMVNLSHASQKVHASGGFMIDYCALRCSAEKLIDPSNYLRSEFIRPEDLDSYTKLGFSSFKILERGAPTSVMAKRIRAYSERNFEGNLLELIQPYGYKNSEDGNRTDSKRLWRYLKYFFRPRLIKTSGLLKLKKLAEKRGLLSAMEWDPVYIDNKLLNGFVDGMNGIECRTTDCSSCGYCAAWTDKAVTIDKKFQTEMQRLYTEAFGEMHSGKLWG
ncbi:MAG: hypothetical protein A2079_06220 [Geobacteraceae bacterium GWC2_48_7]|nr:MAG: hypothetical protein A2079_06220 [Geobacteraceae bacterium GWC2_48_7]